jgi:DNA-binding PadR family transcriptional regulator
LSAGGERPARRLSADELLAEGSVTPFYVALLVLVGQAGPDGANAYEFEKMIDDRVGGVLGYSAGHVYKELKRLAKYDYVEATVVPVGRKRKTMYTLTEKGINTAKRDLMQLGIAPPTDDSEAFVLIQALGIFPMDVVMEVFDAMRDSLEERADGLRRAERRARREGRFDPITRLSLALHESKIRAYEIWLDLVDNEFQPDELQARRRTLQRSLRDEEIERVDDFLANARPR